LTFLQLVDRMQSPDEAAMHFPSLAEHVPSSLQRNEARQSALLSATQAPPFAPHSPSRVHASDALHVASEATQASPSKAQRAASSHA
jgi:hypothetical protein